MAETLPTVLEGVRVGYVWGQAGFFFPLGVRIPMQPWPQSQPEDQSGLDHDSSPFKLPGPAG